MIDPSRIFRENLPRRWRWALLALLTPLVHCGDGPRRDNPFDPGGEAAAAAAPALALRVPLPKALAAVVGRVEATLAGPGMHPVVKVLDHQPLGPARGVIGALQPGEDRVLTVRGYDLDGVPLFEGEARGIAVVAGDTLRVSLDLFLLPPGDEPDPPAEPEPEDPEPAPEEPDGTDPPEDPDVAAPEEPDGTDPPEDPDVAAPEEPDGTDPADDGTEGTDDPAGDGTATDGPVAEDPAEDAGGTEDGEAVEGAGGAPG